MIWSERPLTGVERAQLARDSTADEAVMKLFILKDEEKASEGRSEDLLKMNVMERGKRSSLQRTFVHVHGQHGYLLSGIQIRNDNRLVPQRAHAHPGRLQLLGVVLPQASRLTLLR
jgi:hypothetical protein